MNKNYLDTKIFEYADWENYCYDKLLNNIYQNYPLFFVKRIFEIKSSNTKYLNKRNLNKILSRFKDMSIFRYKIDRKIMQNKMWFQYYSLYDLRRIIELRYIEDYLEMKSNDKIIGEVLEILIISEVIKVHEDKRYKIIINKYFN